MSTQPTTIGRYHVVRRLGTGGMGSVFLARDPELDRPLAIKLVKDDLTDDPELRERFTREARSAARLRHPNIITVFDIGVCDGRPFIAMEYIPGESLADIIRRGRAPEVPRVLGWMESLCAGLAHAHRSGIVHRDIKPGNLMVDPDGALKIVDFGIARLADSQLTREGMLVGTANYMAPEQLLGTGADHRSDIFAVGAVFYELLTATRAFPGSIADGLFNRICHEPPPALEDLCPDLDPEIAMIVNRALEKDPARRYDDLAVMAQHLARVRASLIANAPTDPLGDTSLATVAPTAATVPRGPAPPAFTPPASAPAARVASAPGPPPAQTPISAPRSAYDAGARPWAGAPAAATPSAYDAASRPSGGVATPASGATPTSQAAESASQRRRRADIFLDAAEMAIGQRDFAKASALLDDAARFDPDSSAIESLREQIARGTEAARAAAERRDEVARLMAEAQARLGQGDFAAARDLARRLLAIDPENWDLQSFAGRVEKAEMAARQAALRGAEAQASARTGNRTTLWLVVAILVVVLAAAGLYFASR